MLLHLVVAVSSVHAAGYVLKRKTKNQEKIEAKRGEHVHRDKIEPKRERTKQLNIRLVKLIKPEKSYLKFYIMIIVISNDDGNCRALSKSIY